MSLDTKKEKQDRILAELDEEIRQLELKLKRKKMERNYLEKGWKGQHVHAQRQILRRAAKLGW